MESRKRKRLLIGIIAIVLATFACWFLLVRNTEPTYDGKSLSEWLEIRGPNYFQLHPKVTAPDTAAREDADRAIRFIGTNALPYLVRWVSYEPTAWRVNVIFDKISIPTWLKENPTFHDFLFHPIARGEKAADAFRALGPVAAPAIPALVQLLHSTNAPYRKYPVMEALRNIGPEATPAVFGVLTNINLPSDAWMLTSIYQMGTNARPLVPLLLPHMQDTNISLASEIMSIVCQTQPDPQLVVPVLTQCLNDTRREIRDEAAAALADIGPAARPALPALTNLLRDPDTNVQRHAAEAIAKITSKPAE